MKKHERFAMIFLPLLVVIAAVLWYLQPMEYPAYESGEISKVIVKDLATGEELYVVDTEDVEQLTDAVENAVLTRCGAGIITPAQGYEITFYNEDNLAVVKDNPFILTEDGKIQIEPFIYKSTTEDLEGMYREITELFQTALGA